MRHAALYGTTPITANYWRIRHATLPGLAPMNTISPLYLMLEFARVGATRQTFTHFGRRASARHYADADIDGDGAFIMLRSAARGVAFRDK